MARRQPQSCSRISAVHEDFTDEEREFVVAIDRWKRQHQNPFPTWRDVLGIIHALGYRRADVDAEGNVCGNANS